MSVRSGGQKDDTSETTQSSHQNEAPSTPPTQAIDPPNLSLEGNENELDTEEDDEEEAEEDEEDEEPKLKYASLTRAQGAIYKNGDAASAFIVTGDKMVIGTHNGHVHVLSLPSLRPLRSYHAHSASVTNISVSPFPPPLPAKTDTSKGSSEQVGNSSRSTLRPSNTGKGTRQQPVPNTQENTIHIGTSSIDGNVCVASLVDSKDVLLRNFGRPVQAVALSPDYKNDRSYLSGGMSGQLVLTVGGRAGASANANTTGAAAAAAGWLHNIGLGSNTGTDTVLHSGEGAISTIKWSLSGKYVAWANETGIKFMRSNLHLGTQESDFAWKRMNNIGRPKQPAWDDMANVWKARIEWIDESGLEDDNAIQSQQNSTQHVSKNDDTRSVRSMKTDPRDHWKDRKERIVIGWGGMIWVVDIHPGGAVKGKDGAQSKMGRPEVLRVLRQDDCIISGISQLTPNLLVVLAFVIPDESDEPKKKEPLETSPRGGIYRKRNALQPEMRIIDIESEEESAADTLTVSRYESLSASDYHLGVLPVLRSTARITNQRGALEVIGGIGGTIWDATVYSTKFFSSAASVMSTGSGGDSASGTQVGTGTPPSQAVQPHPALLTRSMKIFIQSPYDCFLATKLTLQDHLSWLYEHEKFEEAWDVLEAHPEAAGRIPESSLPSTPTRSRAGTVGGPQQGSLVDFFADDSSQTTSGPNQNSQLESERRRIGNKWLKQLVAKGEWVRAGEVAAKVLFDAQDWEHWAWTFADAKMFDEFALQLPTQPYRPPISSEVYEIFIAHYLSRGLDKFSELLDRWPPEVGLYDISSVIPVVRSNIKMLGNEAESTENSKHSDWRALMDALAKLYYADGHYEDALKQYIRLQDADAALSLITSHHLIATVVDDIPGLILLRVSKQQLKACQLDELEEASLEPIRLLVSETYQGIISPEIVLKQLSARKNLQPFQFFYMRALWNGDALDEVERPANQQPRSRRPRATDPLATEGKSLVNDSADAALPLFAEYDRPLLFEFLRTSQQYTLSRATALCERKEFVPELVYLLAKEGQTKKALRLIIDRLSDVSQAIAFAKEQDDPDLWTDLLELSMKKPAFVRALLEQAGTAVDPVRLVRRIPSGLEVTGLRDALTRLLREYELQHSISEGAARILRGEVATGMAELRAGQKRGVRFSVIEKDVAVLGEIEQRGRKPRKRIPEDDIRDGACCYCGEEFSELEFEALIAFPCSHAFHLSCLDKAEGVLVGAPEWKGGDEEASSRPQSPASTGTDRDLALLTTFPSLDEQAAARGERASEPVVEREESDGDDLPDGTERAIGPKVRYAKELRALGRVSTDHGCPLWMHTRE